MVGQVGMPWTRYDMVQPGAQAGLTLRKSRRATSLGWDPEDSMSCPEKALSQRNQGREERKERCPQSKSGKHLTFYKHKPLTKDLSILVKSPRRP